jgi:choline dehydrogenase
MDADDRFLADFVIVGAGTAGCLLAERLSADGRHSVLVVEAGGSDWNPLIHAPGGMWPLMRSGAHSWRYRTAPQDQLDGRAFSMPRGKVLGGSSSTNGMVYSRGALVDYDAWGSAGLRRWSGVEALRLLRGLESHPLGSSAYHGSGGALRVSRPGIRHPLSKAFVEAAVEAGYERTDDTDGARREGFGPLDLMAWQGRRVSAARAWLRPALLRPNVRVLTGAQALRIRFDGSTAVGLDVLRKGRARRIAARREILVCGGAFQSPQLLQLSGIGPQDRLRALGIAVLQDLPGVGEGLRDHIAVTVKYTVTEPITLRRYRSAWRQAVAFGEYLLFGRGPLADPGFEVVGFVASEPGLAAPDIRLQLLLALLQPDRRGLLPLHGFQVRASLARPRSTGSVQLASADPLVAPIINQGYLTQPGELEVLREAVRIMRRICAASAFDRYRGVELAPGPLVQDDASLEAYVRATADPDYHSVGTCRMGVARDPLAVVDEDYCVRGVEGLRVVDASVMPGIVDCGTCVPTLLVAAQAAECILASASAAPAG